MEELELNKTWATFFKKACVMIFDYDYDYACQRREGIPYFIGALVVLTTSEGRRKMDTVLRGR